MSDGFVPFVPDPLAPASKAVNWKTNTPTTVGDVAKAGIQIHGRRPVWTKGTSTGAVVGGVAGLIMGDRDGTGSAVDAGIGAGIGYGAGYIADEWKETTGGFKKGVKVQDVAKIMTEEEAIEAAITKANKLNRFKGKAAIGIAALIGVGALASTSNKLHHEVRTDQQLAEAEKKLTRKTNNENEMMSEMFGWNKNVNMGQLAIDMFNDRIGHHLMGNAKFQ